MFFLPTPRALRHREGPLATMQRGYEEDAVLVLKLVVQLTLVRERNRKRPSGSFFPVFPKVSGGAGGRWGLAVWER